MWQDWETEIKNCKALKRWDVITLMKTWTDKKGWNKARENLPRSYMWEEQ